MNPPTVNKKTAATPTPNNRRSSIESDQSSSTKKKSSRACAPCRKRKVLSLFLHTKVTYVRAFFLLMLYTIR